MSRPVRLVVCINERLGAGQRSCVASGSLALIQQLESMIAAEKLAVPVERRECLGRCEEGPVMRFAPAGPFFTGVDEAALGNIVDQLKIFIAQQHA
ncbi:MAG TPA: (2Fe-2S) ferredoxin domain-containing protein [Gammaproteobacteria bacterium]|nr:(2Fe-2S) ferredoxin domain-containing protein [Gammaproteobacteria bacterium]